MINPITQVILESSLPEPYRSVLEVDKPYTDRTGTWCCVVRETTNGSVKERKLLHSTSYDVLRAAIEIVEALTRRAALRLGPSSDLTVDGFEIEGWLNTRASSPKS